MGGVPQGPFGPAGETNYIATRNTGRKMENRLASKTISKTVKKKKKKKTRGLQKRDGTVHLWKKEGVYKTKNSP